MLYQGRDGQLYRRFEQRSFPPTDTPSPARAAYVELLLHDPAAAKRERFRAQVAYWRNRVQALHDRAAGLRALIGKPALEAGTAPIDRWHGHVELAVAQADVMEAARKLADVERAARAAGAELEPFQLEAAPLPEPLPVETEPKRRGPKITCTCGECARCKARESMRRRRAAAAEAALV